MNTSIRYHLAAIFALLLLLAGMAHAQSPLLPGISGTADAANPVESVNLPTEELLRDKRKEVAERLKSAQRALAEAQESTGDESKVPARLSREVELLNQLDILYAQQESAAAVCQESEARKAEMEQKLAAMRREGPTEKPPYSFLMMDSLRDSLSTQQRRTSTLEAGIAAAAEALARAKASHAARKAERRRAKELADQAESSKAAERASAVELARLEEEVAGQCVALRQAEWTNARAAREAHKVRVEFLAELLAWVEKEAAFTPDDLQARFAEIAKQETELKHALVAGERSLGYLDRHWAEAREKLDRAVQVTPALREEERAARLLRELQQRRNGMMQKQIERLGLLRQAWKRRYALAAGEANRDELSAWQKDAAAAVEQFDIERRFEDLTISEIRRELADLGKRVQAAKESDSDLVRWLERELHFYQEFLDARNENLVLLESHAKLHETLLAEIKHQTDSRSTIEWVSSAGRAVATVWHYELTSFDDRSVTVGKVATGLALLIFGVLLSRRLTALFASRVLRRVGIQDGATAAIQSLVFYALVLTSALTALRMVNVPLTVFTFMGGAMAIAAGFGSQKILNNFISGLILLIERPVRVGDVIEVNGLHGTVQNIGMRSTRIRTGTNVEIIVPNSSFLEVNVVNWTLSDSTIRSCIQVGLAYGSCTRDATRWLKRAAEEHGLVLRKPEPFVWFTGFGDNSLEFELHFYIAVRTLSDRRRIESDLRYMIDQYFREAGIVIAYPQRDLHVDTLRPLEVRISRSVASEGQDKWAA